MFRVLEDRSDSAGQRRGAPAVRRPLGLAAGERRRRPTATVRRAEQPAEQQGQGGLAGPVRPGHSEGAARPYRHVDRRHGRPCRPGVPRSPPRRPRAAPRRPGRSPAAADGGGPGTHTPAVARAAPCSAKTASGGPSAATPPPGVKHHDPIDERQPLGHPVLDQHHGGLTRGQQRPATAVRTRVAPSGSRLAVGSSSRRRSGRVAEAPASARRCCSPPERASVRRSRPYGNADRPQGLVDARPDLVSRDAVVLQTEGDVVAGPGHHQLGLRVLEHDADTAPPRATVTRALPLARVGGQQPTQRGEQGALARTRRAEQEHPLAARDPQVDPADRPRPSPGVPPAEAAKFDVGAVRPRRVHGPTGTGRARRSAPAPGSAPAAEPGDDKPTGRREADLRQLPAE